MPGSPGHIRAFDVKTGQQRWIFHTIPWPGEPGYETWPKDAYKISGGANAWSGLSLDPKLGMVFAATGSASFDFYGANRIGDNLYADCVLALDARTGKRIWHFQGIKHDVWDLDFPAAPSLVTVKHNGKPVEAVAQITKTGYVYLLDRKNRQAALPGEVPARFRHRTLAGEKLAETSALPRRAAAIHAAGIHPRHGHQPHTRGACRRAGAVAKASTPMGCLPRPALRGTVLMPGTDGGGEWGGAAYDEKAGLLFVNSNEQPWIIRMVTHDTTSLYKNNCASCHGDHLQGAPPTFPSLVDIGKRRTREQITSIIREGTGRMPVLRLSRKERG